LDTERGLLGVDRRIFTEDEEPEISREIRQQYLTTHQLFASENFTTLIVDRTVFGALKAQTRRLFRLRVRDNRMLQRTTQDAAQDMVAAWDFLPPTALVTGWSIYEGESWEDDLQLLEMID
jgi:hypothetical protein